MYYKSNALYDYIRNNNINNFELPHGDLWQLVYGDKDCTPLLLVVVSEVNSDKLDIKMLEQEEVAYNRMQELSILTDIPVIFIRYAVDSNIENVYLYSESKFKKTTMQQLTDLYSSYGLPVNNGSTTKCLNSAESSMYHHWQRTSLGKSLKVSDLDLIKTRENSIEAIYELKRSCISLDEWEPYTDDYNNFRLLGNLLLGTRILFQIVYNEKKSVDDINNLKIFDVNVNDANLIEFNSRVSLKQFIRG